MGLRISNHWRRMPSPPGVGAAGRMRSLSAVWLLGGAILLAASASCNRTVQGEKLGQEGLLQLKSQGSQARALVVEAGQVHERCSLAAAATTSRTPSRRL